MSQHSFGARHVPTALTGLDFGLRVRVDVRPAQRTIFSGAEKITVQALTAELAEMVSGLRVYSYPVRVQLEQVVSALQVNVVGHVRLGGPNRRTPEQAIKTFSSYP